MQSVLVKTGGSEFAARAEPGQTLASAVWLSGKVRPLPLCSGLGCCGLCRVKFLSPPPPPQEAEIKKLGRAAIAEGWRLACRHACAASEGAVTIELPEALPPAPAPHFSILETRCSGPLLLAVDLGTTSVHYLAFEAKNENFAPHAGDMAASRAKNFAERGPGAREHREKPLLQKECSTFPRLPRFSRPLRLIAAGRELNPQFGAGAEVMSRLAMAGSEQGKKRLSQAVIRLLESIVAALPAPVEEICLAGNTAMTAILLQKDISGLAAAPYRLDYAGGSVEHIEGLPPIFIPPLLSAFVGADVSAGLAALLDGTAPEYPFLLADLGTNGEFVLAQSPEQSLIASVPLGPALEGIGLSHGKMAGAGVACGFTLSPGGLKAMLCAGADGIGEKGAARADEEIEDAQENGTPEAICGVGYLSLLRVLLEAGLLDADGRFRRTGHNPLAARLTRDLAEKDGQPALLLPGNMALYAKDVEEILKVKAAFALAVDNLLAAAGLRPGDLKRIFLAGALGEHARAQDLESLGFIPHGLGARVARAGNASLAGAALMLADRSWRGKMEKWRRQCRLVDLVQTANLNSAFARRMRFGYIS